MNKKKWQQVCTCYHGNLYYRLKDPRSHVIQAWNELGYRIMQAENLSSFRPPCKIPHNIIHL